MPSKVHGLILKISGALSFDWESHSVQIRFLEKKKSKTKRSFVWALSRGQSEELWGGLSDQPCRLRCLECGREPVELRSLTSLKTLSGLSNCHCQVSWSNKESSCITSSGMHRKLSLKSLSRSKGGEGEWIEVAEQGRIRKQWQPPPPPRARPLLLCWIPSTL